MAQDLILGRDVEEKNMHPMLWLSLGLSEKMVPDW